MRLLRAIYVKTGSRSRGVRDVAELETGLTAKAARDAWSDLLGLGLIERFSQDYAARLSPKGLEFIQNAPVNAEPEPIAGALSRGVPGKVFIVHGHDTGAREAVAQFIAESGLEATVLDEPAEQGRTVMEQVELHGGVGYAVLLLTSADLGLTPEAPAVVRPQMNVLMELGYFMGRLGRTRICAFAVCEATQPPSDLAGAPLGSLVPSGEGSQDWKAMLRRELLAAGYEVG